MHYIYPVIKKVNCKKFTYFKAHGIMTETGLVVVLYAVLVLTEMLAVME